ncbi:MAG: hypothetical protein HPY79_08005 [Bacteroidales bacterium]|nr:hypothetical protein [Bacteroidales bacterium]
MILKKFFLIIVILIISKESYVQPLYQPKLYVYPTINGQSELTVNDTAWLNNDICVEFKIDTINMFFAREFKDRKAVYYDNIIIDKIQLFDLKKIEYVKKLVISDVGVIIHNFEPPGYWEKGNCLGNEHRNFIKINYYINKSSSISKPKQFRVEIHPLVIDDKGREYEYFGRVIIHVNINYSDVEK